MEVLTTQVEENTFNRFMEDEEIRTLDVVTRTGGGIDHPPGPTGCRFRSVFQVDDSGVAIVWTKPSPLGASKPDDEG